MRWRSRNYTAGDIGTSLISMNTLRSFSIIGPSKALDVIVDLTLEGGLTSSSHGNIWTSFKGTLV